MIKKYVTSIVLSAGLMLSSGTVAHASDVSSNDFAKILAGLATAAIIAKTIDNKKSRERKARDEARTLQHRDRGFNEFVTNRHDGARIIDGRIRRDDGGYKKQRNFRAVPLPARCRVIVETYRGDRRAFSEACLSKHYKFASKLPRSCETLIRTGRGFRAVYGSRCLHRDGWRVSAR